MAIFFALTPFIAPENALRAQTRIPQIVRSELDFARTAKTRGLKLAFEGNMDSSGIIVSANRFVNALRAYASAKADTSDLLAWSPSHAVTNPSGEFGFTTGPYLYYGKRGGPVSGSGNYFSIWKKDPNQQFKVLFDGGVIHGGKSEEKGNRVLPSKFKHRQLRLPASSNDTLPPHLSQTLQIPAHRARYAVVLRTDLPIELAAQLPKNNHTPELLLDQRGSGWDASGLMYYCYGNLATTAAALQEAKFSGYYVQVWAYDRSWKIIADVIQH